MSVSLSLPTRQNPDYIGVLAFLASLSASNHFVISMFCKKNCNMDKKNFVLYDAGGDVSKRWYIHYMLDGKRVFKYGHINKFPTEAQRRAEADKLIKELCQTKLPPDKIEKAVFEYLESQKIRWRKKTYQSFCSKLKQFFAFSNGQKINDALFESFFNGLIGKVSPKTYNDYINTLSLIFRGVDIEIPKVPKSKVNSIPARYFTQAQRTFLAKEIGGRDAELWQFVQFVFYCFIRPNELRALKVGDVILEDCKILLRGEISKNKKEQYVCIPSNFLQVVEGLVIGRNPSDFLFGNGKKMLGAVTMCRRHQKILKALNFDTTKYKLYSWKHTGAVACAKSGIAIKQLQIQLRHHSLDQVNDYLRQMGADDCDQIQHHFPSI